MFIGFRVFVGLGLGFKGLGFLVLGFKGLGFRVIMVRVRLCVG